MNWIYEHGNHKALVKINDDLFNLSPKRTYELLGVLRRYPFPYFACGVRADRIDEDIAKEMRRSGITGCGVGIESADPFALKVMNKSETIGEIEEGIRHLQNCGIHVCGQFIIGNRGDTLASVQKSIDFARKLALHSARFYAAVLYPGTPLTGYVQANHYQLSEPVWVTKDSPSTGIYFETPEFPLADRIEAIRCAYDAGFVNRFPATESAH